MAKNHRVAFVLAALPFAACHGHPPAPGAPAEVAAPELAPGIAATGRYRGRLSPRQGTWTLEAPPRARAYDYAGGAIAWTSCPGPTDCLPAAGEVALYTDQEFVSFVDSGNVCFGLGCATLAARPMCQVPGTFCGPLQLTSNTTAMLHDVVVQIAQASGQGNQVEGCQPDATAGTGLCAEDVVTAERVDDAASNLTSPILGDTLAGDLPCSFCIGNAAAADVAGLPGLVHVVVPGQTAPQHAVQAGYAVLRLDSEADFDIDLIVLAAAPVVDSVTISNGAAPGATCATSGVSTITVDGHGFGGPAACLDVGAGQCPASGAPPAGYGLDGTPVAAQIRGWSGTQITAFLPTGAIPPTGPLALDTAAAGADDVPVPACGCADLPVACPGTCSEVTGEAVCTCGGTGFPITTQAGVNGFAGCHVVSGNLQMIGSDITTLAPLASLRQVTGLLAVRFSSAPNLFGLRHVAAANAVLVGQNAFLATASFPALTQVGTFQALNNGALVILSVPQIASVGTFRASNNPTLSIVHVPTLSTATTFELRSNGAFDTLVAPALTTLTTLNIYDNAALCQSVVDGLDVAASPADCTVDSTCEPNLSGC